MPGQGRGPFGYPDYQRTNANYDGPLIISASSRSTEMVSEVFPCSQYVTLLMQVGFQTINSQIQVNVEWFQEESLEKSVGSRQICFTQKNGEPQAVRIPNLGPFVRVTVKVFAGKYTFYAYLSNRLSPTEAAPPTCLPIYLEPTLKAKASETYYPEGIVSGPCELQVQSGTSSIGITVEALQALNEWRILRVFAEESAKDEVLKILLPTTACRIKIENPGAVESVYRVSLQPSMTGSL